MMENTTNGDAPRRMTLSRVLELVLDRRVRDSSTVTLSRAANGETIIDVKVHAGGDGDDARSEAEAEALAVEMFDRLRDRYPRLPAVAPASVSLTRNAKGETQVEVSARTGEGGPETLESLAEAVQASYDKARRQYPMLDGRTAAPGAVA